MNAETGALDALVQERLDADTDFQASLDVLSDDEKIDAIETKKRDILAAEAPAFFEKATKAEDVANNQKIRAEKAEKELKEKGGGESPAPKAPTGTDLSSKDTYALVRADVHEDDVDEVVRAATALGISVVEALKDPIVQGILDTRKEHRATAEAANAAPARGGDKKPSASEILEKAKNGDIPEPGSAEAEALYKARRGIN